MSEGSEGRLTASRDAPLGGQAVLEGVMMRGVSNWAVAVRKPAPEISCCSSGSWAFAEMPSAFKPIPSDSASATTPRITGQR